jgi:A/G-specific adenine glycosylase
VAAGGLPSDPLLFADLPGIGPYTAGAIASIAFGVPAPAVDGNVERVVSRVDALDADPRSPSGRRVIEDRVRGWLVGVPPAEFNQAMMELGARVCTPRSPSCTRCPWVSRCAAAASGDPERWPTKKKKKPPTPMVGVAGLWIGAGGAVLCGRRPKGLLAGLWEPLSGEGTGPAAVRAAFEERAAVEVEVGPRLGEVVHLFSHRRLTLEVFAVRGHGEPRSTGVGYDELRWLAPDRPEVGLSALAQRILEFRASLWALR